MSNRRRSTSPGIWSCGALPESRADLTSMISHVPSDEQAAALTPNPITTHGSRTQRLYQKTPFSRSSCRGRRLSRTRFRRVKTYRSHPLMHTLSIVLGTRTLARQEDREKPTYEGDHRNDRTLELSSSELQRYSGCRQSMGRTVPAQFNVGSFYVSLPAAGCHMLFEAAISCARGWAFRCGGRVR